MRLPFPESFTDRYMPKRVEDFVGLAKPKAVLLNFLKRPRSQAFLFVGPSGRGKTTMGLVMCEQLGATLHKIPCREGDMETVKEITRMCHYVPFNFKTGKSASFNFVLVDEADTATPAAQQVWLSKLDATGMPPNTIFVFTANSTSSFEPRFLSRLMVLRFDDEESLSDEMPGFLADVAKREKISSSGLDFAEIAMSTNYNVRDALMKLELESMGAGYLERKPKRAK